ncbi:PAAR domain-containing protein [Acinetobacter schindleri]|uniref:PAAR domain-containing protein n=1 Tax=Acinetobacter schindleri TaxID=108981 RepID=UPI00200A5AE8|nr:PAAR domain-containing protein [Acinetobacter schindleri]MCK8640640.1 PAAR domain-containing protein [Acinetobacter schindleri]
MKALITVGCKTDHGGIITLGDPSFLVAGKAVHLDGMVHYCPKCNVLSKALASNRGFMVVLGRSIVAVGDRSTCGSKFLKISNLAVMNNGMVSSKSDQSTPYIADKYIEEKKVKTINNIYWSYGDNFILLEKKSRFFDDLNLHIETSGYAQGDIITIEIKPEPSEINAFNPFTISLDIDAEGKGLLKNIFQGKTIIIDTEY